MLAFTTIMMITIISAVIISALRPIRPPTASTNLIGSVREFIKNLSNSISKAFSPLEYNDKGEELKIYTDTMKKSRRIGDIRKSHKSNAWEQDDIVEEFKSRFVLENVPALSTISQIYQQSSTSKNISASTVDSRVHNIDIPSDPAEYISASVTQKVQPPLHEQVMLSELKDMIKKEASNSKDD